MGNKLMSNLSGSASNWKFGPDTETKENKVEKVTIPREHLESEFKENMAKIVEEVKQVEERLDVMRGLIHYKELYDASVMLQSAKSSILKVNDLISKQ